MVDELSVDELSVDVLSVDKKSVDEMSVDGLSPHRKNPVTSFWDKSERITIFLGNYFNGEVR